MKECVFVGRVRQRHVCLILDYNLNVNAATALYTSCFREQSMGVEVVCKVGQIEPKWDKSVTFRIRFQSQNVVIWEVKKSRICIILGQSDPLWSKFCHAWKSWEIDLMMLSLLGVVVCSLSL